MKKFYVKPEIELLEIEFDSYMGSIGASGLGIEGGEDSTETPEDGIDANRHRGEWGNLWAED